MPQIDIQGHRGARGLLPENSIPAFRKALELGVDTLEMDVVISRDLQVVVSHDPWFSSVICSLPNGQPIPDGDEGSYRIFDLDYIDIRSFDCGSRGHPMFPQQRRQSVRKPLLREAIDMAEEFAARSGRAAPLYNIETKCTPEGDNELHPPPDVFARLLLDVLQEKKIVDRSTIQSFDVRTLRAAREFEPTVSLSLLISQMSDQGVKKNVAELGFTPQIYSPDYRLVDETLIADAKGLGMRIIPWTVNTEKDMRRLAALGVDGIITDYPDIGVRLSGD